MQSREEIFATLRHLKDDIATRFSVSRIGIFGSVARGEQTEASDIDILVEFSRPVGFLTFHWCQVKTAIAILHTLP